MNQIDQIKGMQRQGYGSLEAFLDPLRGAEVLLPNDAGLALDALSFGQIIVGAEYSERFRPAIPTEAGHPFRAKAATYSDLKPATFWPGSE
jgi:hypothetical protein